MTMVYLVQHGEKQRLPGDPGLTELGRRHARHPGEPGCHVVPGGVVPRPRVLFDSRRYTREVFFAILASISPCKSTPVISARSSR